MFNLKKYSPSLYLRISFITTASVILNRVEATSYLPFSHFNMRVDNDNLCTSSFTTNLTYSFPFKYDHRNLIDFPGFMPIDLSLQEDHRTSECMNNHTLRVAVTFTTMESLFKVHLSNGSSVNIYGSANVAFAFLLDMQEIFKFKIEFIRSVGWITEGPNGTLNGVGSQIHSGEADIALDISKPVIYRAKYLTFLHAIKQDRVAIMFRQPENEHYLNTLKRPFKDGLWKCVIFAFLTLLASTAVMYRRRDIHVVILPVIGAFLARSVHWNVLIPSAKSIHVVLLVSSLFGLTMYSIYSAFIVSSLRRQAPPIRRFQDLVDFDYELMAQRSLPDFTNVFVTNPKLGSLLAAKARKNFVNETNSLRRLFLLESVLNTPPQLTAKDDNEEYTSRRDVAWFVLKSDFYYLALQNNYSTRAICSISKLEPTSRSEHPRVLSMFIPKEEHNMTSVPFGSLNKMREQFNRKILSISERGLGHRHIIRFENEFQPKCLRSSRVRVRQISLYDLFSAFAILSCGAFVAVGVLIAGEVVLPKFWMVIKRNFRGTMNQVQQGRVIFVRNNDFDNESGPLRVGFQYLW